MMRRVVNILLAALVAVFLLGFLYVVTISAQVQHWGRAVQRWTLWATDEVGTPMRPLLRFTTLDACYAASLRHGFTMGETAQCLPYQIGDVQ